MFASHFHISLVHSVQYTVVLLLPKAQGRLRLFARTFHSSNCKQHSVELSLGDATLTLHSNSISFPASPKSIVSALLQQQQCGMIQTISTFTADVQHHVNWNIANSSLCSAARCLAGSAIPQKRWKSEEDWNHGRTTTTPTWNTVRLWRDVWTVTFLYLGW